MLLAVPFGQLRRRRGLSLTVESNQKKGGTAWLEGRRRAEDSNQFGVEDVHGVRLHREARTRFFFSHPCLKTVDDLLGLTNVEIGFLERSSETSSHLSEFFFVEFALVLEQTQ